MNVRRGLKAALLMTLAMLGFAALITLQINVWWPFTMVITDSLALLGFVFWIGAST